MPQKAVVLLSGGIDSTTTLAMAKEQGYDCYALTIHYNQRHAAETEAARQVAQALGVVEHKTAEVSLDVFGGSALTDMSIEVPDFSDTGKIPITYVPARNTVFLSLAIGWAEVLEVDDIFIGTNVLDYSGYPDCRPEYIAAFQQMANLATKRGAEGAKLTIHTPLIELNKATIIQRGQALGIDYAMTVSCYQADEQGRACGRCDSCGYRRRGFKEAGVTDPTLYVTQPTV